MVMALYRVVFFVNFIFMVKKYDILFGKNTFSARLLSTVGIEPQKLSHFTLSNN